MGFVERQGSAGAELPRDDSHGRIGETKVEICVLTIELDYSFVVKTEQSRAFVTSGSEVFEEGRRAGGPKR
jgi:hypothetical protein